MISLGPSIPRSSAAALAWLLACLTLLLPGGVSLGQDGPEPGRPRAQRVFRLAKIPYVGSRNILREYRPFLNALAKELEVDRVSLVLATDYRGILERLERGDADCAWLGTLQYAQARVRGLPLVPLVCPVRGAGKWYSGMIICRKDSPIKKLEDLKGRSFAFVDPDSASGYLFPKLILQSKGIRVPEDLKTQIPDLTDFVGNHSNVVLNVLLRRFDAGAVYSGAIEQTLPGDSSRGREIRILARTEPIVGEPLVVRADMPEAERRRVSRAFRSLDAARLFLQEDIRRFARVSDRDYQYVRDLVARSSPRGE